MLSIVPRNNSFLLIRANGERCAYRYGWEYQFVIGGELRQVAPTGDRTYAVIIGPRGNRRTINSTSTSFVLNNNGDETTPSPTPDDQIPPVVEPPVPSDDIIPGWLPPTTWALLGVGAIFAIVATVYFIRA